MSHGSAVLGRDRDNNKPHIHREAKLGQKAGRWIFDCHILKNVKCSILENPGYANCHVSLNMCHHPRILFIGLILSVAVAADDRSYLYGVQQPPSSGAAA